MVSEALLYMGSALPRVFTTQIQCSFGTYFWEMYTFEFGWSPAEYGVVSSIYNAVQFISYIAFGGLSIFFDINGSTNDDAKNYVAAIQTGSAVIHSCMLKII